MSFGSLFDGGAGGGGGGGMQFPFSTGFSSSPALSLGLVRACLPPPHSFLLPFQLHLRVI